MYAGLSCYYIGCNNTKQKLFLKRMVGANFITCMKDDWIHFTLKVDSLFTDGFKVKVTCEKTERRQTCGCDRNIQKLQ